MSNRDYRSYLIFKLIINSLFESKQVFFLIKIMNIIIFIIIIVEMKNAKKFLKENLTKSKEIAAKIFNVNANSLINFIKRDLDQKNKNHNKILQNHEINTFDDFIQSLLKYSILFTCVIVFNTIVS
jgi:hypothetical protein